MAALSVLYTLIGAEGPDAVVALQRMGEPALTGVAEQIRYGGWSSATHCEFPSHELWPLVCARSGVFSAKNGYVDVNGPANLNLFAAIDPRRAGTGVFSDAVMRAILYCHGLVIEDPIWTAADLYLSSAVADRPVARSFIESAVISMSEVRELIDAGVLLTYAPVEADDSSIHSALRAVVDRPGSRLTADNVWREFEAGFVAGLDPRLQELWREVRGGNRAPSTAVIEEMVASGHAEMVSRFLAAVEGLTVEGVVANAVDAVSAAVGQATHFDNSCDLLCPTPLFADLAKAVVSDVDQLRSFELGRTAVPGIQQLSVSDAVAIRLRSDAFQLWRSDLSTALDRASALRSQHGPEADLTGVVRESVASARARLFGEIQRSGAISPKFRTVLSIGAGLIGGAIGNSTGGVVGASVGAVGAAVGSIAGAAASRWSAPPEFLRRHYLVFQPAEE